MASRLSDAELREKVLQAVRDAGGRVTHRQLAETLTTAGFREAVGQLYPMKREKLLKAETLGDGDGVSLFYSIPE